MTTNVTTVYDRQHLPQYLSRQCSYFYLQNLYHLLLGAKQVNSCATSAYECTSVALIYFSFTLNNDILLQ